MKGLIASLALVAAPALADDMKLAPRDGYVLGAGTWTCVQALEVALGDDVQQRQRSSSG